MRKISFRSLFRRRPPKPEEPKRPLWRKADPQPDYDVIVVGGGAHALATAWFLSRRRPSPRILVIDDGPLGLEHPPGAAGLIRSDHLRPESVALNEASRRLYASLSRRADFEAPFSPRHLVRLCRTRADLDLCARILATMRIKGADARMLSVEEVGRLLPLLDAGPERRFPILGALHQSEAAVARPDALTWAFARAADARGADIVEERKVNAIVVEGGAVKGVQTDYGTIRAPKVALIAEGRGRALAATAGLVLPLEPARLQTFFAEPVKPFLDAIVIDGQPPFSIVQSETGEIILAGEPDSSADPGRPAPWPALEDAAAVAVEAFPSLSHLKIMRAETQAVDVTPDGAPIIGLTSVKGLYVCCGWGSEGFAGVPGAGLALAATIMRDAPHPLAAPFALSRRTLA